ncbi:hypothetical protein [Campylobacter mucosalis]|uniref:hypothetical protein n=1 Tax=Campylobacter mucosalis TaxID=202 RepID=UPI0014704434|nr:hypothetical protein [Campylobacter mucosalis]
MKYLVWFLVAFVFSGCAFKCKRCVDANTTIVAQTFTYKIPSSHNKNRWRLVGGDNYEIIYRSINNNYEDISITTRLSENKKIKQKLKIEKQKWEPEKYFENTVKDTYETVYCKDFIEYVANLKCITTTIIPSSRYGNLLDYYTYCDYYGKNHEIKTLFINRRFSLNSIKTDKQDFQTFKQDIKELFDSIVIHDIDTARMEKEGLMHYDKKYDPNTEHSPLIEWINPEYEHKIKSK